MVWSWCLCVVWCGVVWCGALWCLVACGVWCLVACGVCVVVVFLGVWRRKGGEGRSHPSFTILHIINVCAHAFNTHIQGVSLEWERSFSKRSYPVKHCFTE